MALFHANFFAPSLKRTVDIDVIIPADPLFAFGPPVAEFKTLYLLHGFYGSQVDWHQNINLSGLAQFSNLAIVMPAGDNSFYVDMKPATMQYSKFIGEDLVNFTRKVFHLSAKREDTLIGGFSMGGYGALYNGLKYYDTFGHIIAVSSALFTEEAKNSTAEPNSLGVDREYFQMVFGDLEKLDESDKNLEVLSKRTLEAAKAGGTPLDVYFACGENDKLVRVNRQLHRFLNAIKFEHTYEEGPGTHDWSIWEAYLRRGLERLYPMPKFDLTQMPDWQEKPSEPIDG
jgi:enterochelin esterase-like enzyme